MEIAPKIVIDPEPGVGGNVWRNLLARQPQGILSGKAMASWRNITRRELGLATDRPIIATGHQTLLWHPGILAKYLVADAFAAAHGLATANLVVDQHVGPFGEFEIPIRKADGSLGVRKLDLCTPAPRQEVPMGRHKAFTPPRVPANLSGAIPSVNEGVQRTFDAVHAHRNAPNAALQMAAALADLMAGWVRPMPNVTATDLIGTSLAHAMMREMIADPPRCAECYNRAVERVPEAGIGTLQIRDDYVELPLWRIGEDGRRMHAYDSDVEKAANQPPAISKHQSKIQNPKSKIDQIDQIDLLPRALFMTALVRLGMCDLFIHGTGGAAYDRAMELWIKEWLRVDVGSIAVVTADLRLPLMQDENRLDVHRATMEARRAWHDPESIDEHDHSGTKKREMIQSIEILPRNSPQRKAKFLAMHEGLGAWRRAQSAEIENAMARVERAKRQAADAAIAGRRDWAFPLYPKGMIDELANAAKIA